MGNTKMLTLTLTTLLLSTLLQQGLAIEVSEAEQIALEHSGELLPPPNLTQIIQSDLVTIRSKFPQLQHIYHVPEEWKGGELSIGGGPEVVDKINKSAYGPIEKTQEISKGDEFLLTLSKPYNPWPLVQVLRQQFEISWQPIYIESNSKVRLETSTPGKRIYWIETRRTDPLGCSDFHYWMASVGGEGGKNAKLVSAPGCSPTPEISEAEQIALESSGELLPPPKLVQRVSSELAAIRSSFPVVKGITHRPKWAAGLVIIDDDKKTGEYAHKLNSSKFGPIRTNTLPPESFFQFIESESEDKELAKKYFPLTWVTFQKPYNSDTLAKLVEKELGVKVRAVDRLRRPNRNYIKLSADRPNSGTNTYLFREHGRNGPGAKHHYWTFVVSGGADSWVVKLEKEELSDKDL